MNKALANDLVYATINRKFLLFFFRLSITIQLFFVRTAEGICLKNYSLKMKGCFH